MTDKASLFEPSPDVGDRYIPAEYVGKIDPNFYCRGWNSKRNKYCGARAGQGTDHPGEGRCTNHGGDSIVKHGRYRNLSNKRFRDLVEEFEADPDPMDVFPELFLMRGVVREFLDRHMENQEALLSWHYSFTEEYAAEVAIAREMWNADEDPNKGEFQPPYPSPKKPRYVTDISDVQKLLDTVVKTIVRVEKLQNATSISRSELLLMTQEMGRVVERCNSITDPTKRLESIRDGWQAIKTRA